MWVRYAAARLLNRRESEALRGGGHDGRPDHLRPAETQHARDLSQCGARRHHVIDDQDAAVGHRASQPERVAQVGLAPETPSNFCDTCGRAAANTRNSRRPARASSSRTGSKPRRRKDSLVPGYGDKSMPPGSVAAATTAAASAGARARAASTRPSRFSASITSRVTPSYSRPDHTRSRVQAAAITSGAGRAAGRHSADRRHRSPRIPPGAGRRAHPGSRR